MKKLSVAVVVVMVALLSFSKFAFTAKAGETTGTPELKIAVVDLGRALNEVNEGKKAKAGLEKEFQAKKTELDGMKTAIETLGKEMEKKGPVMSAEAMQGDRENYQKKFMEYQQKAKEYTEALARKEGEMTGTIIGKLRGVVESIAKESGYTFVLERSSGGVVYGPANADITDTLIAKYNSK